MNANKVKAEEIKWKLLKDKDKRLIVCNVSSSTCWSSVRFLNDYNILDIDIRYLDFRY